MWVSSSPEEESKFGNQKVTSWYMQTPNLHVNRMYIWLAKYEIQKPSTCHTTVFCCKFWIDVLHFFTLRDQQFVAGWIKLSGKGECRSTLSNKFSLCCSFFINPPTCFTTNATILDPHKAYFGQIAKENRNSYFAGTDQRAGSGVWWELWVIGCTNSDLLEIWISLGSAFFAYFLFCQLFPLASMG